MGTEGKGVSKFKSLPLGSPLTRRGTGQATVHRKTYQVLIAQTHSTHSHCLDTPRAAVTPGGPRGELQALCDAIAAQFKGLKTASLDLRLQTTQPPSRPITAPSLPGRV